DRALTLARYGERRAEQAAERAKGERGRLLGIGVASYVLLTGLGPHEGAVLRVDATGRALLITGASPHGQGTATALAQIVADELGLRPDDVTVQHGDTAMIPFGVGTYASRNAVVAGSVRRRLSRRRHRGRARDGAGHDRRLLRRQRRRSLDQPPHRRGTDPRRRGPGDRRRALRGARLRRPGPAPDAITAGVRDARS